MRLLTALTLTILALVANGPCFAGEILTGTFVQQRFLVGFDKPMTSNGRFRLVPGERLVWEMVEPFASRIEISREGITETVRGKETLKLPSSRFPALSLVLEIMDAALRRDWDAIERRFHVRPERNGDTWSLHFRPEGEHPGLPFSEIDLKGGEFVETVTLSRASGDRDVIRFRDVRRTEDP